MSTENKYDILLDAAERIVRRDGASKLTLDSVAANAGVSKGGLLYHFPNKEALIAAMVTRMLKKFEDAHKEAMMEDPVESGRWTRAWVRSSVGTDGSSQHENTAAGLLAAVAMNPCLADPMRQYYVEWRAMIANDGIRSEDAMIVSLAADGLWMADLLGFAAPQGAERRKIIERMLEIAGGEI